MNDIKQIDLQEYGLDSSFITQSIEYNDLYIAHIISQEKNIYQVIWLCLVHQGLQNLH
ncbi:hypothetical protein ABRY18_13505 [Clostridioides difficile]